MEYVSTRAEGPLGAPLCMVIVVIWLDVPEIMLVTIWEMNWCDRPGLLEGHGIRKFQALYSSIFFTLMQSIRRLFVGCMGLLRRRLPF